MLPTRVELMISTLLVWRLTNLAIEAVNFLKEWVKISGLQGTLKSHAPFNFIYLTTHLPIINHFGPTSNFLCQ